MTQINRVIHIFQSSSYIFFTIECTMASISLTFLKIIYLRKSSITKYLDQLLCFCHHYLFFSKLLFRNLIAEQGFLSDLIY
jgi:hypothetical protein